MHNFAAKNLNIPLFYSRYLLKDGDRLKEIFYSLGLRGCNITVPHKESAFLACDEIDISARDIKAINTIFYKDSKLYGYNTDGDGFFQSLNEHKEHSSFLILGAGGSAKSIAISLKRRGKRVVIGNRSKEKLKFFGDLGFETSTYDELKNRDFDVVVNSTSAGLQDENLPCEIKLLKELFKNAKFIYDIIYGKETPFLKMAKEFEKECSDGRDMLIYQGVLAFMIFTENQFLEDDVKRLFFRAMEL